MNCELTGTPERLDAPDTGSYSDAEITIARNQAEINVLGQPLAIYEYLTDHGVSNELCEAISELLVCREEYQYANVLALREKLAKSMHVYIDEETEKLL